MKHLLIAALVCIAALLPARAQDSATLVADSVYLTGDSRLTAEGSVEVFFGGARLRAARIVYDRTTDRLTIDGPITLDDGQGTVLLASSADLSRDLRDGLLESARMVLQDQLQLAADEILRAQGRYTQLSNVVASSCQVCAARPTPLWEIRARRVIHDQVGRQLYFDRAQLRFFGVPVLYLPRLRLPDPTVDRATGFLRPELRTTSGLGAGIKLPYFIALGESRDLTITPYFAAARTGTAEFRYRQAFRRGWLQFDGAISKDDLRPGETRGYAFGIGRFALAEGFLLGFGLEAVSDDAYLLDYGISAKDRLSSGVFVTRTRRNEFIDLRFFNYTSLRADEADATLPTRVGDLRFHRRFLPRFLGGEGGLQFELHGQERTSSSLFDADGDGAADGRDVARATLKIDWRRNWILDNGILGAAMFETAFDAYRTAQDPAFATSTFRSRPAVAVELRWPWTKTGRDGASHVIEPVVQLVWSPDSIDDVPNEDSRIVEFDEGNLFSLSRFPGADRYERGLRANLGLTWTRVDPEGWSASVTAGRVLRADDLGQFTAGSGLDGTSSDWIVAAQVETDAGLSVTNRAIFDDTFSFAKDELRLAWSAPRYSVGASYVWMISDPAEGRDVPTSELTFDSGWQIADGWSGTFNSRYDFTADRAAQAGLGLTYTTDCAVFDLSLSRRFTSSTSVDPSTDVSFSVELSGFGTGSDGRPYRKSCGP
jgi:LPS-assembly protein